MNSTLRFATTPAFCEPDEIVVPTIRPGQVSPFPPVRQFRERERWVPPPAFRIKETSLNASLLQVTSTLNRTVKTTSKSVLLFVLLLPGCITEHAQRNSAIGELGERFSVKEAILDHLRASDREAFVISEDTEPRWAIGRRVLVSPDFSRAAHIRLHWGRSWKYALAGTMIDPAVSVVVNGQDGPRFDHLRDVIFSPDGRHLAYVGAHGVTATIPLLGLYGGISVAATKRWVLVVDDWQSEEYESIENLRFHPEGNRLHYDVTLNGEKLPLSLELSATDGPAIWVGASAGQSQPRMAGTGPQPADQLEVRREKDGQVVILNGVSQGSFKEVVEVVWNDDHTKVAVLVMESRGFWTGRRTHFILTAKGRYGPFAVVGNVVWGPGGEHLVFVGGDRTTRLYVDGIEGPILGTVNDLWFGQRPHVPIEFQDAKHFQCATLRRNDVLRLDLEISDK